MSQQKDKVHQRIFGLDILRSVAILLVVFGHGESLLPDNLSPYHDLIGLDGVTMFFVLSGFLIGGIIIKEAEKSEGKFDLWNFWKRRWFRTLPLYFLVLLTLFFLEATLGSSDPLDYQRYLLFSQNLFDPHPAFFGEAWSLSVEEWFYLILPLLFLFLLWNGFTVKKSIFVTCISIILLSLLYRFYKFSIIDIETIRDWDLQFRKQVFTRLDSVALGVLGAAIFFYFTYWWIRFKKIYFVIGVVFLLLVKLSFLYNLLAYDGFTFTVLKVLVESLGTLLLLPLLSTIKSGNGILPKFITLISLISYSMYLLHLSIIQRWIIPSFNWSWINSAQVAQFLNYFLYWILTVSLSWLVYTYFERPTTSLRGISWRKSLRSSAIPKLGIIKRRIR